ncbi:EAL domain-containing protein [Rhodoferax sp.]|uniref:EAL domain-containing protein n=1 Tax=Rhodoferax sp. TaxID=50421 RepID=UPI002845E24C|nr:EAL domain-containing protein [Rhodoferax sp.]MDR3371990.1 EAL domain-containing protein [Rhodoferax sp.]
MRSQKSQLASRLIRQVALIWALFFSACEFPGAWAAEPVPIAARQIVVALDDNYPPYIFRDSNGELTGYLVDYWKLWEKKTGIQVALQASDWDRAKARMQSGRADVIDTIFQDPEREKTLDFTAAYATIPVAIYVNNRIGGISDLHHLSGFLVGVKAGDACIDNLKQAGISTLQLYSSYQALVGAAINGSVRIFCLDEPPANYLLYKDHAEEAFNKAFQVTIGELHRAVHKGDATTLTLLNSGFAAISAKEDKALRDKWMGTRLFSSANIRYVEYVSAASLLVGAALLLWGASLRRKVTQRTTELNSERIRLQNLLMAIPDLVWMKDVNGLYRYCNPMFERFFGTKEAAIVGKTDYDFVNKELADSFRLHDQKAISTSLPSVNEEWITFADDGHQALMEITKTPIRDSHGEVTGVLGISRDITVRHAAEEKIRQLAFYDPLTGLPNRRLFLDRLRQALATSVRHRSQTAVLFIDLDEFKNINDTVGHASGDLLLKQVANRLQSCIRDGDTVARLGGDEFVILLEGLDTIAKEAASSAVSVAEKLLATLAKTYELDDYEHRCTACIGITLIDADPRQDLDQVVQQADLAMYQAKAAGKNTVRFFEPQMQAAMAARASLHAGLLEAVEKNQFVLHYQSQVTDEGRVTGVEALVRWNHPQRGLVSPIEFIPLAEETGLILPLGRWVLETACTQLALWAARPEMQAITIAVNVSARQFLQADWVDQVLAILKESGANPHRLELELTESVLVTNIQDIIGKMTMLRANGIGFSLDDFGTGFSSLSYLKLLPLDQLKIDRSFVRDILVDANDAAIANMVIVLAKTLGLMVIAEGVETEAQRDALAKLGCHAYQGYLYSKPLPLHQFEAFVTST